MPSKGRQEAPVYADTYAWESPVLDADSIRLQLDRVLASPHLCQSKRCQALLRFVVQAYLDGSLERVKERCIGFEVFRRSPDYDTGRDSIVRTTAAEVRKRLAQYYMEPEHDGEIRISLPNGSYLPEFQILASHQHAVLTEVSPVALRETVPEPAEPWRRVSRRGVALAISLAAVATAIGLFFSSPSAFDRFWMPIIQDHSDPVICIEQPLRIFRFTGPRKDEFNRLMVGSSSAAPAPPEVLEKSSVNLSEIEPIGEKYFTHGDLMAAARLSELLARKGKSFQLLGDRLTTFRDLRGRSAILIGQFNNRWTLGLTSGLRYSLGINTTTHAYEVQDRQNPGKALASVTTRDHRPEEFAIVSRIFDVQTEKTVVAVIGTTFLGTQAGAEFLTHPEYMQEAFRRAPLNWHRKNIQVVIAATIVGGTPGPPRVLAEHFW
jgi:hypothetical protein